MDARIIFAACLQALTTATLAWTEAETNDVVHELVRIYSRRTSDARDDWLKAGNVIDCGPVDGEFEDLPRFEHLAWPTFESLFGYEESTNVSCWSEWTSADRQSAFWGFLAGLTNRNWAVDPPRLIQDAVGILDFCRDFECTNAVPVAKMAMVADGAPMPVRIAAAQTYFKVAGDRLERNDVAANIITNGIGPSGCGAREWSLFREGVYSLCCDALDADCQANITNYVHEGARMLYSNLESPSRAVELDMLLLKAYPMYVMSSNRLVVATTGLSSRSPAQTLVEYFTNITNQLFNAPQPLPVVNGL